VSVSNLHRFDRHPIRLIYAFHFLFNNWFFKSRNLSLKFKLKYIPQNQNTSACKPTHQLYKSSPNIFPSCYRRLLHHRSLLRNHDLNHQFISLSLSIYFFLPTKKPSSKNRCKKKAQLEQRANRQVLYSAGLQPQTWTSSSVKGVYTEYRNIQQARSKQAL
jgi:hypothetical protein